MSIISKGNDSIYTVFDDSHDVEMTAQEGLQDIRDKYPEGPDRLAEYLAHYAGVITQTAEIGGDPTRPVTFLLDCSGSMRGHPILALMTALLHVGDTLSLQDRPFQILGFTTKTWGGGEPYEKWRDEGRPINPGRLCPLLHICFKSFEDDWQDVRTDLSFAFHQGLLKENVDGEAMIWATNKAIDYAQPSGVRPAIVYVTDGNPCDQRTQSVNPKSLLFDHMIEVKSQVQKYADLEIISLDTHKGKFLPHPEAIQVEWNFSSTRVAVIIEEMLKAFVRCVGKATAERRA